MDQMQATQKASFHLGSHQLASVLSFLLLKAFGEQVLTWPQTALALVHQNPLAARFTIKIVTNSMFPDASHSDSWNLFYQLMTKLILLEQM